MLLEGPWPDLACKEVGLRVGSTLSVTAHHHLFLPACNPFEQREYPKSLTSYNLFYLPLYRRKLATVQVVVSAQTRPCYLTVDINRSGLQSFFSWNHRISLSSQTYAFHTYQCFLKIFPPKYSNHIRPTRLIMSASESELSEIEISGSSSTKLNDLKTETQQNWKPALKKVKIIVSEALYWLDIFHLITLRRIGILKLSL